MSSTFLPMRTFHAHQSGNIIAAMAKNYIRDIRRDRGMTQADLAEKIGVEPATVQRHENGKRSLTDDMIRKYASALECQVIHILEGITLPADDKERELLENFRRMEDKEQDLYLHTGKAFISGRDPDPQKQTPEQQPKERSTK